MDDFYKYYAKQLRLMEEFEKMRRNLIPPDQRIIEEMNRSFEKIRQQYSGISAAFEKSQVVSAHFDEMVLANQHWLGMLDKVSVHAGSLADIGRIHSSWLESINPILDRMSQIEAAARLSLNDVVYKLSGSMRFIAGHDFEYLKRAALPDPTLLKLQDVIGSVTITYEKLAESIQTLSDMTFLPMFALPGATREVFTTGYALDTIRIPREPGSEQDKYEEQLIDDAERETSGCIGLLKAIDPALATPYVGAHDALRSKRADRARHILISLRELWNHLLRRLAPDETLLIWIPKDDKELLYDGKPTRKARVLYVCRNLNHEPLRDFVVQDTRALVKLIEFFNLVHKLEPGLTDEELRALLLRTDSWLMYILQIWEGTK